jgi:hypothetical protein
MRRVYTFIAVAIVALCSVPRSSAQSVDFGGTVMNNDMVGWGELYNLSFTSHNYGTARSMAMGNAFTSLGADMVSASLNPAGIGMYVDSDVSISPMLQFSKSPTKGSDPFNTSEFKDSTTKFGLASAGGVFTAYRGTGALTNLNIGFVYNRIADFNRSYMNASYDNPYTSSMANVFCTLSNIDGLTTGSDGRMDFGNDPYYWGAVLAYKNGLTNKDDMGWYIDRIGEGALIDQYSAVESSGSIGEYALTIGFNFTDRFYLGATLGIQSVNLQRKVFYGENYLYPEGRPNGDYMPYQLDYMNYMQKTRISGSGVNFKLGMTWRPIDWLRIGVAYHTPTYYALSMRYYADMWSETLSAGSNPDGYDIGYDGYMYDSVESPLWEDEGPNSWDFRSPSRLLVGASFTIARRVLLSVDYERSWYQTIRLQSSPIQNLSYTDTMKDLFKGGNTLRVGAEANVLPFLAVRAGYIWSGSTLRNDYKDVITTHPLITRQSSITAGIGIKFSSMVYLDLAYQYNSSTYSNYLTFYAIDSVDSAQNIESRIFNTSTTRHIAVATLGFRF